MDLTRFTSANLPTPLPPGEEPLTPILITDRSQAASFFDPNYTSPYVQNLTVSVTRSVRPNLQVDVRYIGTLARKLYESVNLNSANFLYNGLAAELNPALAFRCQPCQVVQDRRNQEPAVLTNLPESASDNARSVRAPEA